jgi:hypothetical protein
MKDSASPLEEVFATTCDLWVLPTPRQSHWFRRLDWHLNWQMCKGLAYSGLHLPSETRRVAEEYGFEIPRHREDKTPPLLIGSEGRLPARMCLVIDAGNHLDKWFPQVIKQMEPMKVKTARVFLPTGASVREAKKIWKAKLDAEIEFTADLEAAP